MPFTQNARDNLVAAFTMAQILYEKGEYLPLSEQGRALQDLQRMIGWQIRNPFQSVNPGRSLVKQGLKGYITLSASVDLFMRFTPQPECPAQNNLAYISQEVQNFLYTQFKHTLVVKLLANQVLPNLSAIDKELKKWVKEKIQGYAKKLPDQDRGDWQIFVAEIDTGIETLSRKYKQILRGLHEQFTDFRKGHIQFTQNYIDRCLFLAMLEDWLLQVPNNRYRTKAHDDLTTRFNQKLIELQFSYNEIDLKGHFDLLHELQKKTLTYGQYIQLAETLIKLKPKYDAYRAGQDCIGREKLLKTFSEAWPKPALPRHRPASSINADLEEKWNELRDEARKIQNDSILGDELKHKAVTNYQSTAVPKLN